MLYLLYRSAPTFAILENHSPDCVKPDMSPLRQLDGNKNVRSVVELIVSMHHKPGIQVVAKDVEREAELFIIQKTDCELIQDYSFFKPEDEASFFEYIKRHTEWRKPSIPCNIKHIKPGGRSNGYVREK